MTWGDSPFAKMRSYLRHPEVQDTQRAGSVEFENTPVDTTEEDLLLGADSEISPLVSIVMPTMNEEAGIREFIERVKRAVRKSGHPTEVIISDDSTDRTPEIARELGAIVVEPDEAGYGYAYRYAFDHCRGDYIVIGDADTTYDFEQFPKLLEPVVRGEADMVMGSRLDGDIKPGAMPALHQYIGNPLLTKFLNAFYDAGVSDAHSGFRAFRAEMLDELDLQTTGMEFASEMIMAPARATSRLRRSRSSITNARGKRRSTVSATAGGTSGLCF